MTKIIRYKTSEVLKSKGIDHNNNLTGIHSFQTSNAIVFEHLLKEQNQTYTLGTL